MNKKIYINGRFLTQGMTGINRFGYETCIALAKLGINFEILTPKGIKKEYDLSLLKIRSLNFFKSHLWEQITLPLFLWRKNALLINFSGLGPIFKSNQIITIHDLSFMVNPSWFSKSYYYIYNLLTPIVAKNAKKILTVSNYSKMEIERILQIPSEKITVVYNAVSEEFINKANFIMEKNTSQPYLLAVFSLDPRKNLESLILAYNKSELDIPLLIIGGGNSVFGEIKYNSDKNIHILGRVTDEELVAYYKNASLFIYPSLYEGFGLPPLEAIMCGCKKILLSDLEVFHEIYGDNVNYANGNDVDSLSLAIKETLNKEDKKINTKELKRIYNWKNVAKIIMQEVDKE